MTKWPSLACEVLAVAELLCTSGESDRGSHSGPNADDETSNRLGAAEAFEGTHRRREVRFALIGALLRPHSGARHSQVPPAFAQERFGQKSLGLHRLTQASSRSPCPFPHCDKQCILPIPTPSIRVFRRSKDPRPAKAPSPRSRVSRVSFQGILANCSHSPPGVYSGVRAD